MATEKCVRSPYTRFGGKARIAQWIVSHFPEHHTYLEPFCGSAAVLFAKPVSKREYINDLDSGIVNMFRQIRRRPAELAAFLWATPDGPELLGDAPANALERAGLELAKSAQYFCGSGNPSWAFSDRKRWENHFLRIAPAAARLRTVRILNEDAITTINRVYQDSDALIYADPPYLGHEKDYRHGVDYSELVAVLHNAKANVVVSEYPAAAKHFRGWRTARLKVVVHSSAVRGRETRHATEMLFMNF